MIRNVLTVIAVIVLSLIVCAQERTKAPDFSITDINNRLIRLSDYRGKVVLLNFWGTWCPPCRAEIPELIKLQREYGERGLRVLGINYPPEERTVVHEFAQSMKINYPILIGISEMAVAYEAGTGELPVTIIIDREGMIRQRIHLSIALETGDRRGQAAALTNIGAIYVEMNEPQEAPKYIIQASALYKELGNRQGSLLVLITSAISTVI